MKLNFNLRISGLIVLVLTSCQTTNVDPNAPSAQEKYALLQREAAAHFETLLTQVGLKKTVSEYESLAVLHPEDALVHFYLGTAYLMQFQQIDSLEQWNSNKNELSGVYQDYLKPVSSHSKNSPGKTEKKYLKKATQSLALSTQLAPDLVIAHLSLGNIAFYIESNYQEASACYKRSFELSGNPLIAGQLAASLRKQGLPNEARLLCEDLLAGVAPNCSELYSQLALACMELKDFDSAINYGHKAIELRPGNIDAHISLAKVYREAGQFEKSNDICDKGLALNPFITVLYSSKGINCERIKRYDEALEYHRKVLELDPYYYKAYNNIGVILELQGRVEDAIKAYEKATRHIDRDFAHKNLINALQKTGRDQDAFEAATRYLQHSPEHSEISRLAGISLFNLRRFNDAKPYFNPSNERNFLYLSAIELSEKNNPQAELLARKALAINTNLTEKIFCIDILAKACLLQGKLEEAFMLSTESEQIAQDKELRYNAICRIGIIYDKKGNQQKAITAYNRAIALLPDNTDAYRDAAGLCLNANNHQQSLEYCTKLLSLDPNDSLGLEIVARIYRHKKPDIAQKFFLKSWKAAPDRLEPLGTLCEMLILGQKPDEAEPHLQKLEELFPNSWRTLSLRGLYLGTQNQPQAALPYFEKATRLEPSGHNYNSLGYTHFLLKNYPAAKKAYTAGLRFDDSTGIIYFNLALLHRAQKNAAEALDFLNLSVKNGYPDNKKLRTELLNMPQQTIP